jgi:hypothetical protein
MKTILVFLALLMSGASLDAAGAVHGRVYGLDETGACVGIVAGARIELKNAGGTVVASATSSGSGFYSISGLEAAPYRYTVKATGWRDEDHERGFELPEGDTDYVHDFLLMLESGPEAVTPPPMAGQTGQSAVHGRVYGQDETGRLIGPLPGARIELLSGQGGNVVASATAATPSGYYEIKNLASADYAYRVSAAGYTTEDAGRGFAVPKDALEYVHDFILTKPPLKKDRCDLAVLVVKLISSGKDKANDARLPVANAKLILQPSGNLPTPLNQPFVTDAKGECVAPMIGEGDYTVAIDAPECEPFTGVLKVVCDKDDQVIFELQPCNELLHGYVRVMLTNGWGSAPQAKAACELAYQRALKADAGDCSANYACALAQLSAGDYNAALQSLAAAIGKKQDGTVWDRACEARLWMNLCMHQPSQALREVRSLVQNHYATRPVTPAAQDTAHVCGIALGLFKGPWKDHISAGDAVLLESDLLSALKGDLRAECAKARDHVSAEYATLKTAEDAARNKLITEVTEKRNTEVARMAERQGVISKEVAACDAEIQTLQATVNQFDQQYRVQVAGFMQQQQMNAVQIQPLNARVQQISACMAQDQINASQNPTQAAAIFAEIQQHQIEIQQIRQQMTVIQNQDAVMAANIANLQAQFQRNAGTAQASLNAKLQQRSVLAREFETLENQRTGLFDPTSFSTPEIDDLVRRCNSLKTYSDLPLELRREELIAQFDCGAAKEPKRLVSTAKPVQIIEPAFTAKRPAANAPMPSSTAPRAMPVPENAGMPPLKPLPAAATAVKPLPSLGDPAEIVLTNNHDGAVRVFGINVGSERESFMRSLKSGEEVMLPATIGQTLIIRATTGGQELHRQKVGKKLEVVKLGVAR